MLVDEKDHIIDRFEIPDSELWPEILSYSDKDCKIAYFIPISDDGLIVNPGGNACRRYHRAGVHYVNYRFILQDEPKDEETKDGERT